MIEILLVEDDIAIIEALQKFLQSENFKTYTANGQKQAEEILECKTPQLLLVDLSLNDGDGFGVCNAAKKRNIPVIFLTASGDELSVVRGLDMGADDYIAKPFRPRELLSRIKRVLRQYEGTLKNLALGSGVIVDTDKGVVTKNGEAVELTALEYRLLNVFINNRGILISRNKLLEDIWDIGGDFVNDNTLTVYIKRLREKIEDDPQNPVIIKTMRGLGYRMD
ncbi:MAG: response regulator transcription factor [Lachnospiraceae bacterium]|jgi:DNA-binding response OmpR family regulator|nr:response regulator transcription factor [Lachnospiraceae bacterium]MBR3484076.1 response regulator transcription factor [Lachnospiraceae bacterium]MCR4991451.1 response regulator transcription factor [Lachnospiraceae bacterium]